MSMVMGTITKKIKIMKNLLCALLLLSLFFACKEDPIETPHMEPEDYCPKINDTVFWDNHPGFGYWRLASNGFDGDIGIPTGGASPINLRTTCGWHYYLNETGGTGHVYGVYGLDTAALFRWANGNLHEIILSHNWQGITERGTKMGDSLSQIQAFYPELYNIPPYNDLYGITVANILVQMKFDAAFKLEKIDIMD